MSITSAALESDTRTLRFARSLSQAGYRSMVVEGVPSRASIDFGLPLFSFDTRALSGERRGGGVMRRLASPLATIRETLRRGTVVRPLDAALALAYRAGFWWKYGYAPRGRVPSADLYILHGFFFYPLVAQRLSQEGVPYIYDAHDFYSVFRKEGAGPFDRDHVQPFLERVEEACCRRAAQVTTVSDGVARLISARFGRSPMVLRNVQDTRLQAPSPERDMRNELRLAKDAFIVVVIGNYKSDQAVEWLLNALPLVGDRIHAVFVGAGYDRFRVAAARLGIAERAHFVGPVPSTHLLGFVAKADAAAVIRPVDTPNDRAALPNGFFQSVAAGLPMIVGNNQPEVIALTRKHGFGLEVDAADPTDIAGALQRLVDDHALRDRLRRASEHARSDLTWEQEEGRLLDLVASVMRGR